MLFKSSYFEREVLQVEQNSNTTWLLICDRTLAHVFDLFLNKDSIVQALFLPLCTPKGLEIGDDSPCCELKFLEYWDPSMKSSRSVVTVDLNMSNATQLILDTRNEVFFCVLFLFHATPWVCFLQERFFLG